MSNNYDYAEISFIDLCKDVLKKWKVFFVVVLIFAIVFGLYGLFLSKKSRPESATEVKELTSNLTNEQKMEVEDSAEIINSYREMYNRQKLYNEESIFQNLDAYNINALTLTYYVNNYHKVTYPVIEDNDDLIPMIQTYTSVLLEDSLYAALAKAVDNTISPSYYQEVISVDIEEKTYGVFSILIYANTEDLLSNIGEFIKSAIEDKKGDVQNLYGEHDLILTSETRSKVIDTEIAVKQQENIRTITNIASSIKSVEDTYSGSQLTYLKYLVHEELEEQVSIVKYVAIGAILGLICTLLFFVFKYIFSRTVKTEDALVSIIKADSFGVFTEDIDFIASKINNAIEVNGSKKVALVSDVDLKELREFALLLKSDVEISINPLMNKDSFELLMLCDSAIFIESLKISKVDDVLSKKTICDNSKIKVLGSILI